MRFKKQLTEEETKTQKEEKAKFDEVLKVMDKYDKAEKKAKWLASPEYAQ